MNTKNPRSVKICQWCVHPIELGHEDVLDGGSYHRPCANAKVDAMRNDPVLRAMHYNTKGVGAMDLTNDEIELIRGLLIERIEYAKGTAKPDRAKPYEKLLDRSMDLELSSLRRATELEGRQARQAIYRDGKLAYQNGTKADQNPYIGTGLTWTRNA